MYKSIREKYNIPLDAKIILYVGNISENKNQRQMVEIFSMLPSKLCEQTYVLFCGNLYDDSLNLKKLISLSSYPDHLILCGSINRDVMPQYYQESDAVALLSYSEGFGLSLVEGMYYGLPCTMFSDIDAFEDIYNEKVAIAIDNRNNDTVAKCVESLLDKEWDRNAIKRYSRKFSSREMGMNYVTVYKSVLKQS